MMAYRWQSQDGPPSHTCLSWRTPLQSTPAHLLRVHICRPLIILPGTAHSLAGPSGLWLGCSSCTAYRRQPPSPPDAVAASHTETAMLCKRKYSGYTVAASLSHSRSDETQYQCSRDCAQLIKSHSNFCQPSGRSEFIATHVWSFVLLVLITWTEYAHAYVTLLAK